jgi:2-polyprenyl-6-methoxyphenol hydroxylase-like FAD-dependent oxidoreductase
VDDTKSEKDAANGGADGIIRLALSPEQDKAEIKSALLSRLNNLEQPVREFATKLIEETDPKYIYLQLSEEAAQIGPSLVSSDGKVVCVGDSANAMSASYGQSMNFALEDAVTLALCVRDADNHDEEGFVLALKAYEHSRLDRCEEMQRRSAERAAKAMKGEQVEDVSKWIFQWKPYL